MGGPSLSLLPTVLGPVDARHLAPILYHEHVVLDNRSTPSVAAYWLPPAEAMVPELADYAAKGGRSVISLTNQCMGRDVDALRTISKSSGVSILVATGLYTRPASPPVDDAGALSRTFVEELRVGIGDTGVRAAVIGEIGTGAWPIGPFERGLFTAAARAHVETGAPIATHTHAGMYARWQLDALTGNGVPPERIVLGHVDEGVVNGPAYVDRLARLADRGAYLGFDTVGITYYSEFMKRWQPSDRDRAVAIRRLADLGFADRILLSHDICRPDHLKASGGWGYAHIFESFMPLLAEVGVDDRAARALIEENPLRWLQG
jgi:phosphotriesterase-related protein